MASYVLFFCIIFCLVAPVIKENVAQTKEESTAKALRVDQLTEKDRKLSGGGLCKLCVCEAEELLYSVHMPFC
jgi:hypothetical protein